MRMNFGKNLKTNRELVGLTQKDLAKMLDVSFKTVSHWEAGYSEPSLALLAKLKEVLKVSYEDLLDE